MIQGTYNFPSHIKGDTFDGQRFTIVVNDVPLDLTNAVIKMDLKIDAKKSTSALSFSSAATPPTIQIIDAENGIFELKSRIIDIPAAIYHYDIEIDLPNNVVKTYISGDWEIVQDVTHG